MAAVSAGDAFVPRFGGAVANVALAGGAGDDAWGSWLRERLGREGIATEWFDLVPGAQTPVAIVTVDVDGEVNRDVYGERVGTALGGDRVQDAVRRSAALYFTSGGPEENEVTMRAREHALSLERPVVFAPEICVERWRSRAEAAAAANACVPDALLVRATEGDAALMTGEDDPERAAVALLKAGARMVVITFGLDGAILRGELRLDVDGVPTTVVSAAGAGEVLTGVLLARLAGTAFYPAAVAASLPEAVAESARASERWGVLE